MGKELRAIILGAGKGTRMKSNLPKVLHEIFSKSLLGWVIDSIEALHYETESIVIIGHGAEKVEEYLNKNYKYTKAVLQERQLGTGHAVAQAVPLLHGYSSDVLIVCGDTPLLQTDTLRKFVNYHKNKGGLVTLFTHPNNHPYDSGLIISDNDDRVLQWLSKEDERPRFYKNRVNAGLHVISPKILTGSFESEKIDLDRQLLKPLAGTGKMYVYDSPEYVKDMGTPDRYYLVQKNYIEGIVSSKNLNNKQKAIFLDRDGTINKYAGFINSEENFELLPGVSEAIKKINDSGFLAIIVTNQPVIARGEATYEDVEEIHKKLETLLGLDGAYIDALYFCPHHPHSGYDGEVKELKIECECRKPKPGMLYMAADKFNIDLEQSWMIGDSSNDILAGKSAGTRTGFIGNDLELSADVYGDSLLDIIDNILEN